MNSLFEKEREEIKKSISSSKYDEPLEQCFKLLELIGSQKIDSNTDIWFLNLRIGICYRKKNQIKKALHYINKSLLYCTTEKEYIDSFWLMGNIYYQLKDYKKAVKFYRKCLDYFQINNLMDEYIHMAFNIALIEDDDDTINSLLVLGRNIIAEEWFFNNAHEALCLIYIKQEKFDLVEEFIVKINDCEIVKKLRNKMQMGKTVSIL
jgi:tetratricopeptide (TPR) repeat protein